MYNSNAVSHQLSLTSSSGSLSTHTSSIAIGNIRSHSSVYQSWVYFMYYILCIVGY